MLVNITTPFRFGGADYYVGQNPDVDPQIARQWIADGKATLDTGPQDWPTSALASLVSGAVNAPATLDSSNAASYNGATVNLAAAGTLTISNTAWALLGAGLVIQVGQSGSATLAFSGTATKENSAGTSASSVTLAAAGVYALTQSPTGSPNYRLSGGAAL